MYWVFGSLVQFLKDHPGVLFVAFVIGIWFIVWALMWKAQDNWPHEEEWDPKIHKPGR